MEQKSMESADGLLVEKAQMQADFGLPVEARATLRGIVKQDADVPDLLILKAKLGDRAPAERYLAK